MINWKKIPSWFAVVFVGVFSRLSAADTTAASAPAAGHAQFALRQVVLIESEEEAKKSPSDESSFVVATGALKGLNTAELTKRLIDGKDRIIDTQLLGAIVQVVTIYLKQNDFPVADIVVPEQNIRQGVLRLVVYLGKLREIRTKGNYWFRESVLQGRLGVAHGDTIRLSELDRAVAWANNTNPFRQLKLNLDPLPTKGEYDLIIGVEDRLPLRFVAGYENTGNDTLGNDRYSAAVTYGNVWGREHQFTYQFVTTRNIDGFKAHAITYQAPLRWRRHVFQASGTYVKVAPPPFLFGLFTQKGESIVADAKYIIPFKFTRWQGEVSGSAGFRQTNNNLEFSGTPALGAVTDTFAFALAGSAIREDGRGKWITALTLTGSPGTLNSRSRYTAYRESRIGANPLFGHAHLLVQRTTHLTGSLLSNLRAIGQMATTNLLPSEQFSVGGMTTVRGYKERILSGDHGYMFSHELQQRLPSIAVGKRLPKLDLAGVLFWDYGRTIVKKPLRGEVQSQYLASVGVGLRAQVSRYFSASIDYGQQLEVVEVPGEPDHRLHVRLSLSY